MSNIRDITMLRLRSLINPQGWMDVKQEYYPDKIIVTIEKMFSEEEMEREREELAKTVGIPT